MILILYVSQKIKQKKIIKMKNSNSRWPVPFLQYWRQGHSQTKFSPPSVVSMLHSNISHTSNRHLMLICESASYFDSAIDMLALAARPANAFSDTVESAPPPLFKVLVGSRFMKDKVAGSTQVDPHYFYSHHPIKHRHGDPHGRVRAHSDIVSVWLMDICIHWYSQILKAAKKMSICNVGLRRHGNW